MSSDPPKAQLDALKDKQQDLEEDVPLDEGEDEDAVLGEPIPQEGEELQVPVNLTCGVMLQKEGPEGLYDEKCGKDCPDKMAGLCKLVGGGERGGEVEREEEEEEI